MNMSICVGKDQAREDAFFGTARHAIWEHVVVHWDDLAADWLRGDGEFLYKRRGRQSPMSPIGGRVPTLLDADDRAVDGGDESGAGLVIDAGIHPSPKVLCGGDLVGLTVVVFHPEASEPLAAQYLDTWVVTG